MGRAVEAYKAGEFEQFQVFSLELKDAGLLDRTLPGDLGTLLTTAIGDGRLQWVDWLLQTGADIHAPDIYKATPLMNASKSSRELTEFLLTRGADVQMKDTHGRTALHCAAQSVRADALILDQLLQFGADVNATENAGRTPLHEAAGSLQPEKIELLLKRGADPQATAQGELGTPLHYLHTVARETPVTNPGDRERCISLLSPKSAAQPGLKAALFAFTRRMLGH